MRRLLILRHSKAAPSAGHDDYERSLTESGRDDARRVGEWIAMHGLIPDLVIYSSAERTRQTAEIAAAAWPEPVTSRAENALYEATRHFILMLARGAPESAGAVMIVGHNPGMSDIANQLVGGGMESDRLRMAAKFPTSALAVLDFPIERWTDVSPRSGRLAAFVTRGDRDDG